MFWIQVGVIARESRVKTLTLLSLNDVSDKFCLIASSLQFLQIIKDSKTSFGSLLVKSLTTRLIYPFSYFHPSLCVIFNDYMIQGVYQFGIARGVRYNTKALDIRLKMKILQFFKTVKSSPAFSFNFSTNTANIFQTAHQRTQKFPEAQSKLSLRVLTEEHQEDALKLMEEVFVNGDPARLSYYQKYPERTHQEKLFWSGLKDNYAKEIFSRGLSVGCFDLENREELISAIFTKDHHFSPPIKFNSYENSYRPAYDELEKQLFANAIPKYSQMFAQKKTPIVEHWFIGVKDTHKGKRLMSKMMSASDYMAYRHGIAYTFCWATNFRTAKTAKRLNYEKIAEVNVKQFIYKGEKYFEDVVESDKYQSLWIRKLDERVQEQLLQKLDI